MHLAVAAIAGRVPSAYGLFAPGGFAIARDGSIYVTNNGILAGAGQVLRIPPR